MILQAPVIHSLLDPLKLQQVPCLPSCQGHLQSRYFRLDLEAPCFQFHLEFQPDPDFPMHLEFLVDLLILPPPGHQ